MGLLSGCATFKSLDVAAHLPLYERIFIYSGTRLDWAAIAKNDAALSKLKATPPCYPLVDLPLGNSQKIPHTNFYTILFKIDISYKHTITDRNLEYDPFI